MTGPTAYVLNASDLKTIEPSNSLDKYADDTYLIVPASNSHTIPAELDNVSAWAAANNLSLNVAKSCEMIVRRPRLAINDPSIPPALPEVKRVSELNILGVRMSDRLEFTPHINHITTGGGSIHLRHWESFEPMACVAPGSGRLREPRLFRS